MGKTSKKDHGELEDEGVIFVIFVVFLIVSILVIGVTGVFLSIFTLLQKQKNRKITTFAALSILFLVIAILLFCSLFFVDNIYYNYYIYSISLFFFAISGLLGILAYSKLQVIKNK